MKTKTTTQYTKHMHVWEIALLLGLAAFLASGAAALGSRDAIADKVVRLHVLANSDSEEDQALKLKVRDRVLERAAELLEQSENRDQAEECLAEALPELEALEMAYQAIDQGAHGVDMGRNIFQSDCPAGMAAAIGKVVHEGYTAQQAYEVYETMKNSK